MFQCGLGLEYSILMEYLHLDKHLLEQQNTKILLDFNVHNVISSENKDSSTSSFSIPVLSVFQVTLLYWLRPPV